METSQDSAKLVSVAELSAMLGVTQITIARWKKSGVLPPCVRLGRRLIRWRMADIEKWIQSSQGTKQ